MGASGLIPSGGVPPASFCFVNTQLVRASQKFSEGKKEKLLKGICVPHISWLKDAPAQGWACISMHITPKSPANCTVSRIILFYIQPLENTDLEDQL